MTKQQLVKNKVGKQDSLQQKIAKIVKHEDLSQYRSMLVAYSKELKISEQDCAAALLLLQQPDIKKQMKFAAQMQQAKSLLDIRMVRYRLEVGLKDQVSVAAVKQLLVDETGLEQRLIGFIDIQNAHTVISLPEGMPAEIFQLLKETQMNQRALNIKRLGNENSSGRNKNYQRNRRRKYRSKNNVNRTQKSAEEVTD